MQLLGATLQRVPALPGPHRSCDAAAAEVVWQPSYNQSPERQNADSQVDLGLSFSPSLIF